MILVGIGANLPDSSGGTPRETCAAALDALEGDDIRVAARARWYESAPVPASDQPWYVNGAARLETALGPEDLLARLHAVEAGFGRARAEANAARTLDLDLLDHNGAVRPEGGPAPVLPHPRLAGRAFVLLPLQEVAPDWTHPVSGKSVADLIAELPPADLTGAAIRLLDDPPPVPGL